MDLRLPLRVVDDFDLCPSDLLVEAGAQSFNNRLLSGKSARIMRMGIVVALAIGLFALSKNTVEKAVAMAFDRILDPTGLDNVGPDSLNHTLSTHIPPRRCRRSCGRNRYV